MVNYIRRAGDCLSYAIGNELIASSSEGKFKASNENLFAFVAYAALNRLISEKTVCEIKEFLLNNKKSFIDAKIQFSFISNLIIPELRKEYLFSSFEELIGELNSIDIPDWYFVGSMDILKLYPNIFVVGDRLFYILETDGRYYFRCIHAERIFKISQYNRNECKEYNVSVMYDNYTISTKYSKLLGFNKITQTLYLQPVFPNTFYAEYIVNTKQEIINHYRCIGVIEEMPVIIKDGQICMLIKNDIRPIKRALSSEMYEVINHEYIYVTPTFLVPSMFRPYYLFPNGDCEILSDFETNKYVTDKIKMDIKDPNDLFFISKDEFIEIKDRDVPEVLSLDYLNTLLSKYNLAENKNARIYHFVVKLLSKYLPVDQDVLEYFLALSDASKRMNEMRSLQFIGENLYWKMEELELSGVLKEIVYDREKLKNELMKYVYWDDETIIENERESNFIMYVGEYTIDEKDGEISSNKVTLGEASYFENLLTGPKTDNAGKVVFNLETGAFQIQYNRQLTEKEIDIIKTTFRIFETPYNICINRK